MEITTIGLDLAKNVFQVHAINAREKLLCASGLLPPVPSENYIRA